MQYTIFLRCIRMGRPSRNWHDQKVSQLYHMAMMSRYEPIRREVMKVLGILERTGNEEAAWAIEDIKKQAGNNRTR